MSSSSSPFPSYCPFSGPSGGPGFRRFYYDVGTCTGPPSGVGASGLWATLRLLSRPRTPTSEHLIRVPWVRVPGTQALAVLVPGERRVSVQLVTLEPPS